MIATMKKLFGTDGMRGEAGRQFRRDVVEALLRAV